MNNHQTGRLSFVFCSDEHLLTINKKYLKHDYYTDIITFQYNEENVVSADIFISIDRVKDNALTLKSQFITELHRVIIHGVLHLLGFTDRTNAEKNNMRILESNYLLQLPDYQNLKRKPA